jgi:hypothetical protein
MLAPTSLSPPRLPLPDDVTIQHASDVELERLCELFGEVPHPRGSYRVLVRGSRRRIVGFSCLVCESAFPRLAHFRWRVLPRFVASGVERQLIAAVLADAAAKGAAVLCTLDMLIADSHADRLLAIFGFGITLRDHVYAVDLRSALTRSERACRRLTARGRLPSEATAEPLDDRNWPEVAALAVRNGLLAPERAMLDFDRAGFSPEISAVVVWRGQVQGALLASCRGRHAEIAVEVVEERLRTGTHWAHALLARSAGRWMESLGIEVLHYRTHPLFSCETRNFAARCGGRMMATQYGRALTLAP